VVPSSAIRNAPLLLSAVLAKCREMDRFGSHVKLFCKSTLPTGEYKSGYGFCQVLKIKILKFISRPGIVV
jgi:hypothetical protein